MASADLVIAFDARIGNLETALKRTEESLHRTETAARNTAPAIQALEPASVSVSRSIESLNGSLSRTSGTLTTFAAAARSMGLDSIAGGLDVAVTAVNGVSTAVTAAGASAETAGGLFSGALGRIAGIAGPLAAAVTLLQSLGLGIREAGHASTDGTIATQNYATALDAARVALGLIPAAAVQAANAVRELNNQLRERNRNLELEMGGYFEQRTRAQTEIAQIDAQLAQMETDYAAARASAYQGGRGLDRMRAIENERTTLAERRAAAVEREATATREIESRREPHRLQSGAAIVSTEAFGPPAPTAPTTPARTGGGGISAANRAVEEAIKAAERLYAETREPLEKFGASMQSALNLFGQGAITPALGGIETVQRAVTQYAQTAYSALTNAGVSASDAQRQISASLDAQGQSLANSGISFNQWQGIASAALAKVAENSETTNAALEKSVKSASSSISGAFSGFISSVALSTSTVEDAWKKMLLSILNSVMEFVYQMTLQAAIMKALKTVFTGFGSVFGGGPTTSGNSVPLGFAAPGDAFGVNALGAASGDGTFAGSRFAIPTDFGGRSDGDVTININNTVPEARVSARETTNSQGDKLIEVLIDRRVEASLASGRYDATMSTSFGVSRKGRV